MKRLMFPDMWDFKCLSVYVQKPDYRNIDKCLFRLTFVNQIKTQLEQLDKKQNYSIPLFLLNWMI